MITLSVSPSIITLAGDTYTRRNSIRAMGGTWDKAGQVWNVPNNPANLAQCEALAAANRLPAQGDAPAPAAAMPTPHMQAPAAAMPTGQTPDLMAALSAFIAQQKAGAVDADAVRAIVADALAPVMAAIEGRPQAITVTIERPDAPSLTLEGTQHAKLPTLIKCLMAGLHVWLAGPSGSGKTHGAEQAALALGLTFRLQGAMTMAHELTGFVDAAGHYHVTPFVETFRNGGLILLDELDAGSNEALLALNAALANGIMCLPNGEIIRAHADFKCVGAANTFGAGATAEYVGRTRIDAAFLQRFGARITWAYDEALERSISGNEAWAARVQRARANAAAKGLKVLITPRASQAGAKLQSVGFTADEAAELTYLADLSPEQRRAIGG